MQTDKGKGSVASQHLLVKICIKRKQKCVPMSGSIASTTLGVGKKKIWWNQLNKKNVE